MERVRLGLIFVGLPGTQHTRTLQKAEEYDFVVIADVDDRHAA